MDGLKKKLTDEEPIALIARDPINMLIFADKAQHIFPTRQIRNEIR